MRARELSFADMNEADIREEFLAPLLDHLGYHSGAEGKIVRELPLRYPRSFLGTKKPRTDPYLKGRADYLLEVRGHARWILEAKSPSEIINQDAIEQARSYAIHPEVNAVYFALSNGRRFSVYRTTAPPGTQPIFDVSYEQMIADIAQVERILSVASIKHDFHDTHDAGTPIGHGLRSVVKIASGTIAYTSSTISNPVTEHLSIAIVDGAIERGELAGC